jgi:hypothetical protein
MIFSSDVYSGHVAINVPFYHDEYFIMPRMQAEFYAGQFADVTYIIIDGWLLVRTASLDYVRRLVNYRMVNFAVGSP